MKKLPVVDTLTYDVETFEQIDLTKWCEYHKQLEPKRDFYLESSTKAKKPSVVRNMCIEAWNIVYGKTDFSKIAKTHRVAKEESYATVFDYLKD